MTNQSSGYWDNECGEPRQQTVPVEELKTKSGKNGKGMCSGPEMQMRKRVGRERCSEKLSGLQSRLDGVKVEISSSWESIGLPACRGPQKCKPLMQMPITGELVGELNRAHSSRCSYSSLDRTSL